MTERDAHLNPAVRGVMAPPVATAKSMVAAAPRDIPLVDLSQAVPSYPPAAALQAHLASLVRLPDTAFYAPAAGLPGTQAAIAEWARRTWECPAVEDDRIVVTAGCNEAFCLAIGVLAEPGDDVVLTVPHYFNHDMWLRATGIRPAYVHVRPEDGMLPDPERAESLIGPRTRAIVLVTPNNPCGVTYDAALLDRFGALAERHGVALVLDETYVDFRPATGGPPHRLAASDRLVQLVSFSKSLSLAGYRAGALIASRAVVREAVKLADCLTIGAPRIAQEAVAFGLDHLAEWRSQRRAEMLERTSAFTAGLAALQQWQLVSAGAFFAYARAPLPAEAAVRRLASRHAVITIPGPVFGPDQEQFVRLAFGNLPDHLVPVAIERLGALA